MNFFLLWDPRFSKSFYLRPSKVRKLVRTNQFQVKVRKWVPEENLGLYSTSSSCDVSNSFVVVEWSWILKINQVNYNVSSGRLFCLIMDTLIQWCDLAWSRGSTVHVTTGRHGSTCCLFVIGSTVFPLEIWPRKQKQEKIFPQRSVPWVIPLMKGYCKPKTVYSHFISMQCIHVFVCAKVECVCGIFEFDDVSQSVGSMTHAHGRGTACRMRHVSFLICCSCSCDCFRNGLMDWLEKKTRLLLWLEGMGRLEVLLVELPNAMASWWFV